MPTYILLLNFIIVLIEIAIEPLFFFLLAIIISLFIVGLFQFIDTSLGINILLISLLCIWVLLLIKKFIAILLLYLRAIRNAKFMIVKIGLTAKEYLEIGSAQTKEEAIEIGQRIFIKKAKEGTLAKGVSLRDEYLFY